MLSNAEVEGEEGKGEERDLLPAMTDGDIELEVPSDGEEEEAVNDDDQGKKEKAVVAGEEEGLPASHQQQQQEEQETTTNASVLADAAMEAFASSNRSTTQHGHDSESQLTQKGRPFLSTS